MRAEIAQLQRLLDEPPLRPWRRPSPCPLLRCWTRSSSGNRRRLLRWRLLLRGAAAGQVFSWPQFFESMPEEQQQQQTVGSIAGSAAAFAQIK